MFITIELLKRLDACEQGLRYFERFYPNGAEMIDVIRDRHINKEFLHWGREYLTNNEQEQKAYAEVCGIENSEGYWYSVNVKNSKYVVKSKEVTDSISVFESTEVVSCSDVVNSDSATNSKQIFYSSMIDDCQKVFRGTNIVESINVCNSTMVVRSKNVIDSSNIFGSSEIVKCNTVTDSHFCQNCINIENCLFCEGLENAQYYIFNKPVDESRYKMIEKQYLKYFTELLGFIREWPENLIVGTFVAPTRKFDDWYSPISEKFWKWVRTLPNFDSMLIYNITMLPEILID